MTQPASQRAARLVRATLDSQYNVVDVLGETVSGALYRALDTSSGGHVAIRVMYPEMAAQLDVRGMFERESIVSSRLAHPSIAAGKVFGLLPDGSPFMVLEDLGPPLSQLMASGPISLTHATRIASHIALGLTALHKLGIVHRALSPESVHVSMRNGTPERIKLIDFRFVKLPPELSPPGLARLPTLSPSSPALAYADEALHTGGDAEPSHDFRALGSMFYEMGTGARPARESTLPPMTSIRSLPIAVDALASHLSARDPSQRASIAMEVVRALEILAEASPSGRASMSSMPDPSPPAPVVVRSPSFTSEAPVSARMSVAAAGTGHRESGRATAVPAPLPPGPLPGPSWFRRLPLAMRLYVAGIGAIVLVIVGAIGLRSLGGTNLMVENGNTKAGASAPERPRLRAPVITAGDREEPREASRPEAPAAAQELRSRLEKDFRSGNTKSFIDTLEQLLEQEPTAAQDRSIAEAVLELLMRIMVGGGEGPERLFSIIETKMGTAGPDLLYELMTTRGGSRAAKRADELLRDESVRNRGTPALQIAYDLRMARRCEDKAALLERAKEAGDRRTLGQLQMLNRSCSSSSGECCLQNDPKLKEAMDTIKSRL